MSHLRSMAQRRLMKEFKELTVSPADGILAGPINEDNLFEWEALVDGPSGTAFDGGCFAARVSFPKDYPLSPPTMRFTSQIWHPNVFPSGAVCISILHSSTDEMYAGYEPVSEQWSPLLSLEKVLISVMCTCSQRFDWKI